MAIPGRHEGRIPRTFYPLPVFRRKPEHCNTEYYSMPLFLRWRPRGASSTEFGFGLGTTSQAISARVRRFVAMCDHCSSSKTVPTSTVGPKLPPTRRRPRGALMSRFSPDARARVTAALAIYCPFSHYLRSFPCRASTRALLLKHFITNTLIYGRPDKLIFDSQMDSNHVNQILQALKITTGVLAPQP